MRWWPRSILQLLLLGVATVVAPLCVGIFYTVQTLDELARQSQSTSHQTIELTRSSQQLESALLDLERRARQYVALESENLLALFVRERQQLLDVMQQLEALIRLDLSDEELLLRRWERVNELLVKLPEASNEIALALPSFSQLNVEASQFQQQVLQAVDQRLTSLVEDTDEIQRSLMLMVGMLSLLTFIFALLLVYWIYSPVRQIRKHIRRLGIGDMSGSIEVSGPAEMKQLGEQLEWLRVRLDELEQEKLQFLRHMSHELKTPLASLREGADLMAEGVAGPLHPRQREVVDIIQANSRELQRLIENLLDYNQLMASQSLVRQPLSLSKLWQRVISKHQIMIERQQLQLQCGGSVEEWSVDETKFATVLDNLLSNAVNYTPVGGVIKISWRLENGILIMDIANSGKRISETDRKKIFAPFYQGESSRQGPIKGSGIGLSVARECVQAHGGELSLLESSAMDVCFRLRCPAGCD